MNFNVVNDQNEWNLCLTPMVRADGSPVMRNTWFVYPKSKRLDKGIREFISFIEKEQCTVKISIKDIFRCFMALSVES